MPRSKKKRYVLEGTWSGYALAQSHVVHRTVISAAKAAEIEDLGLASIYYTDGTALWLTLREAKPRERIIEIHGYDSLIDDCLRHKVRRVADLPKEAS